MGKRGPASCSTSLTQAVTHRPSAPQPLGLSRAHSSSRSPQRTPQSFLGVLVCTGGCLSPLSPSRCLCHLSGPTGTITPPRSRTPQAPHLDTVPAATVNSGSPEPMRLNPDLGCCLSASRFPGMGKDQLSPWGLFHISEPSPLMLCLTIAFQK